MSPKLVRRLINIWPPLLFSGVRVTFIAPDWTRVEVELRLRWWNRNAVGTMFGGTLFAMTDPFYPLMLQHHLGPGFHVWTKSAQIEFIAPGRSLARAIFQLSAEKIAQIRAATEDGRSHLQPFPVSVSDAKGTPLAQVIHTVYVRRKRQAS